MAARRSHTKSRNGCQDCKRRKVKCDEAYPSCFNCSRRGVPCSLAASRASLNDIPVRPSSPASWLHPRRPAGTETGLDASLTNHGIRSDHQPSPLQAEAESWGCGLELMHHYSTVTANTFALRPDMQYVWRTVVPEIGYGSPFVLRGILAVAALHKAHLLPVQRDKYLNIAAYHQMLGLEGFRTVLSNVGDDNWKPAFCFSSTVVLYFCSLPTQNRWEPASETVSEVLKLFILVRGLRATLLPCQAQLLGTQFAPLSYGVWIIDQHTCSYENDPPLNNCLLPQDIFGALRRLSAFFHAKLPKACRGDYELAVVELRKAASLMAHAGARVEIGMLMFFPWVISENIMADIQAANPYAMVLLSYFALLLSTMELTFWFMRGWSKRLFAAIEAHIKGHPLFWNMVKWPREQAFELYQHWKLYD